MESLKGKSPLKNGVCPSSYFTWHPFLDKNHLSDYNVVTQVCEVIQVGHVRLMLPDDLHFNLKRQALDERISLTTILIKALREYLDNQRINPKDAQSKDKQSPGLK